jgi:hypothetical protein
MGRYYELFHNHGLAVESFTIKCEIFLITLAVGLPLAFSYPSLMAASSSAC